MQTSAAARRYAEAVFELGDEAGALDQWQEDLDLLGAVMADEVAVGVLQDDKAPLDERMALLNRALTGVSPLALNLARLLLTRKRLALLPEIAAAFGEMLDRHNGVVRARVTTAVPLTEEDERLVAERLRAMTGARDVRVQSDVDPAIIGGLVARVGDRLIDGSTRSRLIQLRRRLANAPR